MFIIRKIGKTLRGQSKPYQIISASLVGALIGFAPPFGNAPLYLIGVILLLAILNANFFIATFTAGICKLLALALMPVSFELGLVLVDGPMQPLFRTLINAPVTALMGFDYYVTSGGIVLALIVGTALGIAYMKIIGNFRKKMAKIEADSEKYADFASKRTVRILMWVLFGGKAKLSYAELTELKKIGNPIRPLGAVFALLVVILLVVVQQFFSGPIITALLKNQLEQFHGATVDLEGVDINMASGQVTVQRIAMADPDNLDEDLIRAQELTAKISTKDLLRKRITIDSILVDDAQQGAKRDRPGVLIGDRPEPSPPPKDGKSIEEWFEQAKEWKERLETYHDWYKKLKGPPKDDQASEETTRDRLREWAERNGHGNVRASHLIEDSPTVLVKDIKINKLRATWPDEETLNIHATYWSTHPALAPDKPSITVKSSADSFDLDLAIAPAAFGDGKNVVKITLRNQSIDKALAGLDVGSNLKLSGGTWQAGINGDWSDADGLDLPLILVMQDTTLALPGIDPTPIERMPIEFGVTGELGSPGVTMDMKKFADSLLENGGKAVLNQYVGSAKGWAKDALGDALGEDRLKDVGKLLDGLPVGGGLDDLTGNLFGGEDDDEEKDDDQDKPSTEDRIRDGIGGFLNRDND